MYTYFIGNGEFIKIGVSVDPWNRLASLQTAHYDDLTLLAVMPGGTDLESGLHRAFSEYSKRGEWFAKNPQLLAFIEVIKATFPGEQQRQTATAAPVAAREEAQSETEEELEDALYAPRAPEHPLGHGESFTFLMTHKGSFRYPSREPHYLWDRVTFGVRGYLTSGHNDTWNVVYAPGLRFDYADMQHVTVTRVGEINPPQPGRVVDYPKWSIEGALKDALKNAVYNRKNTAAWLGVYNDERYGITIAVRKEPGNDAVRLDVPDEVIDYWRQYRHPSPLPDGVSIEA